MSTTHPESSFSGPLIAQRYRLGRLLGQGGQGNTFHAYDRETGSDVAVKAFALGKAADWKRYDLFKRECRVLRSLDHPRVPAYLDELLDENDGVFYLVMQYIEGRTLYQRLAEEGVLNEAGLWQALWQMVDVLAYLHSQSPPVVHRDIKPRNIIAGSNGELVLVDFGGVRQALRVDGGSTIVGTFGYMAPEQLHGAATPATDLYSLGATLINLGTGLEPEHLPRQGLRIDFSQHLKVSPQLSGLLQRLCEPEPGQRPLSGADLKTELQRIAEASDSSHADPVEAQPPSFESELPENLPPQLGVFIGVLMTVIGTLGTVAATVVNVAVVPLVFSLISIFSRPEQRAKLQSQRSKTQAALREAGRSLRQLGGRGAREFERSRQALPGRSRGRRRQVRGQGRRRR